MFNRAILAAGHREISLADMVTHIYSSKRRCASSPTRAFLLISMLSTCRALSPQDHGILDSGMTRCMPGLSAIVRVIVLHDIKTAEVVPISSAAFLDLVLLPRKQCLSRKGYIVKRWNDTPASVRPSVIIVKATARGSGPSSAAYLEGYLPTRALFL